MGITSGKALTARVGTVDAAQTQEPHFRKSVVVPQIAFCSLHDTFCVLFD